MVSRLVQRAWTSPTLTTWASFAARSLNLVVVLPLALARLSAPEVQLWQMVVTLNTLLLFLDLGLSPTFTRLFARAVVESPEGGGPPSTDFQRVERIWRTMFHLYRRAAAVGLLLLVLIGAPALHGAISSLEHPRDGWMAFGVVVATAPLSFWLLGYASYLQGLNHVAVSRRWEALAAVGAILSSLAVLAAGGRALALVASSQVWVVLAVLRNHWLARNVENGRARTFGRPALIRETWDEAWPAVWRSGLGVVVTSGFIQATGVIYAQIGKTTEVASYLVALRYLTAVSQFSQAPFYSKLPSLARLQALGQTQSLLVLAARGMRLAHASFAIGCIGLAFLLPPILRLTGSEVPFVAPSLWWLMVAGIFLERFGAMHLQLYSTTNRIVWHIANGVSGAIIVSTSLLLLRPLGVYAFPIGILAGYGGFYAWYSARLSYREFRVRWIGFESRISIPCLAALAIAASVQVFTVG